MSDLQPKIAALPEWPHLFEYNCDDLDVAMAQRDAALARLELALEFIRHHGLETWQGIDTGRDALLKALEVPK